MLWLFIFRLFLSHYDLYTQKISQFLNSRIIFWLAHCLIVSIFWVLSPKLYFNELAVCVLQNFCNL